MRAGKGERGGEAGSLGGGQLRGLMLSVRLCLSSALGVLHRSFHGKCTGTDYHRLARERARERGLAGPRLVFRR